MEDIEKYTALLDIAIIIMIKNTGGLIKNDIHE